MHGHGLMDLYTELYNIIYLYTNTLIDTNNTRLSIVIFMCVCVCVKSCIGSLTVGDAAAATGNTKYHIPL